MLEVGVPSNTPFLTVVQNLALRVCFRNWDTNYHTLLSTNNIPSLSKRRLFSRLSLLFSTVKEVYSLPHNAPIEIREYHHFSQSQSHPESFICCILLLILLRHSSPLEHLALVGSCNNNEIIRDARNIDPSDCACESVGVTQKTRAQ